MFRNYTQAIFYIITILLFTQLFCGLGFPFVLAQKDLLEDCHKLLERFKYPWEMMPLMYAILKDAPDLEEASKRIDEGWLTYLSN